MIDSGRQSGLKLIFSKQSTTHNEEATVQTELGAIVIDTYTQCIYGLVRIRKFNDYEFNANIDSSEQH